MVGAQYPDVRVYSSAGLRKAFPVEQVDSVQWEHLALGGFGQCTVTFKADFDDVMPMVAGDRLEVWISGTLRYRGYLGVLQADMGLPDQKTLTVYGMAEKMNGVVVNKRYLAPLGVNANVAASYLFADWVAPFYPNSSARYDSLETQIYDLTVSGSARSAFDQLMEKTGDLYAWGWEVGSSAPNVGADQLYVIQREGRIENSVWVTTPKYKFSVGGKVKALSLPSDQSAVTNSVHLFGGTTKWPNLVKNPSFDQIEVSQEGVANLINNGSFEDWESATVATGWSYVAAALHSEAQKKTGNISALIPRLNDYVQQSGIKVVPGQTYNLVFWAYITAAYGFELTFTPDVGSAEHPTLNLPGRSDGIRYNTWNRLSCTWTAPESASTVTIKIRSTLASANLAVDDVCLWRSDVVGCPNWECKDTLGKDVVWGSSNTGEREGGHVAQIVTSAAAETHTLIQAYDAGFSVKDISSMKAFCYVKNKGGASAPHITAQIGIKFYASGYSFYDQYVTGTPVTLSTNAWTRVSTGDAAVPVPAAAEWARVFIVISNVTSPAATDVLVDTVMAFADNTCEWDDSPYYPEYCRESNHEWWLRTSDAWAQAESE